MQSAENRTCLLALPGAAPVLPSPITYPDQGGTSGATSWQRLSTPTNSRGRSTKSDRKGSRTPANSSQKRRARDDESIRVREDEIETLESYVQQLEDKNSESRREVDVLRLELNHNWNSLSYVEHRAMNDFNQYSQQVNAGMDILHQELSSNNQML